MNDFQNRIGDRKIVLAHDWLTGMRGGERVLEVLCQQLPSAKIVALIHDPQFISKTINAHEITCSRLQSIPGIEKSYRYFLPFFPAAVEAVDVPEADLMISCSHCVAKGFRAKQNTKHLCYCFTPMRYAWMFYNEYFGKNPLKAMVIKPILAWLRSWDRRSARRVDRFVAISRNVQKRIKDFYGRDSDVVYPPVDMNRCTPGKNRKGDFDLVISALVPYKRIDLAVRAYTKLGYPLKVVGNGAEYEKLQSFAGPNIELLRWLPDNDIVELYRNCRMLIFPGEEDFGIVPLEVQACGAPVVAYRKGGAMESVTENVSGVFFNEQTVESLLEAVDKCASTTWDPERIRACAGKFGVENFLSSLALSVESCLKEARE